MCKHASRVDVLVNSSEHKYMLPCNSTMTNFSGSIHQKQGSSKPVLTCIQIFS